MMLYLRLAWRNIWRHRRRTLIVALAIAFTLWMMMWYDGMVTGFEDAIYGNALKVLGGNIQIHAQGYQSNESQTPLLPLPDGPAAVKAVLAQPQVEAASLRVVTSGLATNRAGAFAVGIIGIEPEKELPVSMVGQYVSAGRYLAAADRDQVYIGNGLALAMDLKVGDRFTLAGRAANEQMRSRTVTVVGIYDVGMVDIEKRTVYMSLGAAQDLYGLSGKATEVAVTLKQIGPEPQVIEALKPALPGYEFSSWQTSFPELEDALATKGKAMDIFGGIIMVVVAIGILNLLLMAVYERTREIGVLGALGWKPGGIAWLFVLEGLIMGLVGTAAGIVLAVILNGTMAAVGLDFTQFSSLTEYTALITGKVYMSLGFERITQHVLLVLLVSVLASLYPASQAANQEPAKSLHFV